MELASVLPVIAQALSATLVGIEAVGVTVEAEMANGVPQFSVVGLGATAVRDARFREQAALRAIEQPLLQRKITVNLAPADLRKDSSALDLGIGLATLAAQGDLPQEALTKVLPYAELSLDGSLRPVRGVLAACLLAAERRRTPVVPWASAAEAAMVGPAFVAERLDQVVAHLRGERRLPEAAEVEPSTVETALSGPMLDLAEVQGQGLARRALEVAAVGDHNLLFSGHPGCGKTMLAQRLPGILPPLDRREWLEVARVRSAAGLTLHGQPVPTERPFRAPHRSLSEAGLIGGGRPLRPGEVALAHRGVLFLDEMPELSRRLLEALRQPLEDRQVVVVRAEGAVSFPADFMLVGAMNPCPCGWYGHPKGRCTCDAGQVERYRSRLSGPVLDRFDLRVSMPGVPPSDLLGPGQRAEGSEAVRGRVMEARARAQRRRGGRKESARTLREDLCRRSRALLQESACRLDLTARSTDRVLRVGRSVADLAGKDRIEPDHLWEALQFR